MIKEITNCQECPCCNNDNYGYDGCNLNTDIWTNYWEMPKDKVHKDCPLKESYYIIRLKE